MIILQKNILTQFELDEIEYIISNFIAQEIPVSDFYRNDYYKQQITLPKSILSKIYKLIQHHTNRNVSILGIWLNRIDTNSNIDDTYHKDDTDLSFVLYPTNSFSGGELESKTQTYPIIQNSAYIILHNIEHRVKRVTSGIRWSIAVFCKYTTNSKNII